MVIYFSGNGNSQRVAEVMAHNLDDEIVALEHDLLLNPGDSKLVNRSNRIVWVFPVYSWGIPPVVANFISLCNIEGANNAMHHLIVTCGDDAGYTDRQWCKLIASRGWRAMSATSVIMPNTYVLMKGFDTDSDQLANKKLEESTVSTKLAIERIKNNCNDSMMTRGSFPWIKSRIIYPWFTRHAMSPRPFHYTDACISCGLCARQCPMDNITLDDGHPHWHDHCALCLRCYHRCPTHAVAYGNATTHKHQYFSLPLNTH